MNLTVTEPQDDTPFETLVMGAVVVLRPAVQDHGLTQGMVTMLDARRLVRLRHKMRRIFGLELRAQHGHRGRVRAITTINLRWMVAIELGT